jgi:hypothetical protein
MNEMEFSWRMVATLVWPVVVLAGLIIYRKWITERLTGLTFRFGSVEVALNAKVNTTAQDIGTALSHMEPAPYDEMANLVYLMPKVSKNIRKGIQAAFDKVCEALKKYYPDLGGIPRSQIPQKMDELVDNGQLDEDVASSVTKLYQLLGMQEWRSDRAGDTRGYAFLMLAEGAIPGIMRSAKVHGEGPFGPRTPTS